MYRQAVIIASGASLHAEDVYRACTLGRDVYCVNDAYRLMPHRHFLLYACDEQWWEVHEASTRHIAERWTTCDEAARVYGLSHIPGRNGQAQRQYFDSSGQGIIYGLNSGFQALNLAYVRGVRDALLLGFDMGGTHFFGEHPPECANPSPFPAMIRHFNLAAPAIRAAGMRVRNATRGGALECFERVDIDALARSRASN